MNAHHPRFDLRDRARRAMIDAGFEPDFTYEARIQLATAEANPAFTDGSVRDLRSLLWSSIDNRESRDLDQIEVCEPLPGYADMIRILIGIADVDALVPLTSPLDRHARINTTSVYTGVTTFSMLPESLSTDLTSMNPDEDRIAIVIDMIIDREGRVTSSDIYRAQTCNTARLNYDQIGPWLENKEPVPEDVARITGLAEQLRLQHEAATRLNRRRFERGALDFENIEAMPIVKDGAIVALDVPHKNPARYLIEDFMIAANSSMAEFLATSGSPSIQRIVRAPARWPRIVDVAAQYGFSLPAQPDSRALADFLRQRRAADPDHFPDLSLTIVKLIGPGEYVLINDHEDQSGHFGLAVSSYTHSTAPNRRYADLTIQRLLKAYLQHEPPPYRDEELADIALRCTERSNAARKVERLMRKVAAAALLTDRLGEVFSAIVTGASDKGVYVRLLSPPVEGRIVRGEQGLDVGDSSRVRLISTDIERGFIDFESLHSP